MRLFFLSLLTIFVGGCTSVKYVPVETVRVDSVFVAQVERDSIYEHDSVFVALKADTVFLSRVQYRYHDRYIRDTVSVLRCDTVTKLITVEVERNMTFWERLKLKAWSFFAIIIFIWCFIFIVKKWFGAL